MLTHRPPPEDPFATSPQAATLAGTPTGSKRDNTSALRWMGWRRRFLIVAALLGCLGIFSLVRYMSTSLALPAHWVGDARGQVVLADTSDLLLRAYVGSAMVRVHAADGQVIDVDDSLLRRAPRWTIDGKSRARIVQIHKAIGAALAQGPVTLEFDDGRRVMVAPRALGLAGLGALFWPMAALALLLYLIGMVVWLAKLQARNLLFALIAVCQATNLLFIALESTRALPLPSAVISQDLWFRMSLDVITAAAIVHAFTLHPVRLGRGPWLVAGSWSLALLALGYAGAGHSSLQWWAAQSTVIVLGALSLLVLTLSHRERPNPFTLMMRRFGLVTVGSLILLTLALAAANGVPGIQHRVAEIGSGVWYVFLASLLLLVPFLSRSGPLMREFALLAGISTVATSLDLLFVALFSMGQFASVTLSVFIALAVYAGARQWILNQLTGSNVLTLERSFERLYRVAREVEAYPERRDSLMLGLLRELFDPLEVSRLEHPSQRARVQAEGASLLVPAPRPASAVQGPVNGPGLAWQLHYARRGKRLFTSADARLADRVTEQLGRAISFDKAVERGRSEERQRLAQDLHDDIGARLLTLMYKAQSPEMEDYVRHTLQDLKTLTRGLAASDHRLSHAVGEWKADIGQRLTEAQISLAWSFSYDNDVNLTVVQWSGLTRIMRELVTNSIYHAKATHLEIRAHLEGGQLTLTVQDDGVGHAPEKWSHGLGLGGIRKRVKLLGGKVAWREAQPSGIVCEVNIPGLDDRFSAAQAATLQ